MQSYSERQLFIDSPYTVIFLYSLSHSRYFNGVLTTRILYSVFLAYEPSKAHHKTFTSTFIHRQKVQGSRFQVANTFTYIHTLKKVSEVVQCLARDRNRNLQTTSWGQVKKSFFFFKSALSYFCIIFWVFLTHLYCIYCIYICILYSTFTTGAIVAAH